MKLEFQLLGDLAVIADGDALDLGGTRQQSVLALLLLNRNRSVGTELLADRLWPDEQPATAIKTVQVYVSRLRRVLGSEAPRLTTTTTGYRLAVTDDELDAARYERGLRLAREALAAGSVASSMAGFEDALALWSGPALGELASEQFALREADRLEELHLQGMEELFDLRIGAGAGRGSIADIRRLLGDEPGRERLWRLLMLALYADGRQGEALEAYHDARRYLAEELGIEPGPELTELERLILTQEVPLSRPIHAITRSLAGKPVEALGHSVGVPDSGGPGDRRTRRVVTVFRADVVRAASERDVDPEILEAFERRVSDVVQRAVERHGGIIDQADHDGLTAVFGLTVAREDDALRALRAVVELGRDTGSIELTGDPPVFRIGLSTGEVLTGVGDRRGSRITGAPVQLAGRLAAKAAPHEVLMAADTERLVRPLTSTEDVRFGTRDAGWSAVRLLALTDGDAIVRRTGTPFVGREAELDALVQAFERVASDDAPGVALVIGPPGVGKSRLVAESFHRMTGRARILRSRCLPYGDGITYWPIRELVMAASGIQSDDPRDVALGKLQAIVARVDRADLVGRRVASVIGLADQPVPKEEIAWSVRWFFEALAAERPLVILVDDVQWAEIALLELFDHVIDLGHGPILLVTVARPEFEEERPDRLARPSVRVIRLEPLDASDAATLMDHLAPELPPGPLRAGILEAAEGNPLFVEQFVAYAADEPDSRGRRLDPSRSVGLPIPPTIVALLAARLDRLPDDERRTLERAAVIGRAFPAHALHDLLSEDDRVGLPDRLARLARRDLIRRDRSDRPGDDAYRFRHLLIRDAAYGALPKRDRADLHERFADSLDRPGRGSDTDDLGLIVGHHLEQAYRYRNGLGDDSTDTQLLADRAVRYLAPSGRAALERGDPYAAVSLLRRAADLAPLGRVRAGVLIDLRTALRAAGDGVASDMVDAEAVELMIEFPDEALEHRRRLNEALFVGADRARSGPAAYTYYQRVGDQLGMVHALEVAALTDANEGRYTSAVERLDLATALASSIGRPDRSAAFSARAALKLPDSPIPIPEALERCLRYLDLAGDNRESRATILLNIGELEWRSGVHDDWRRRFEAGKVIIDDLGLTFPLGAAIYPIMLGDAELAVGEPIRVLELLRWSCSTLDRLGDVGHLGTVAPLTGQALLALGRHEEAERYALWGRDIAYPEDLDAQCRWRTAMSGLRSQQGRHDEAIALAREAVALLAPSEFLVSVMVAHLALAGAHRAAGDEPSALVAALEAQRIASMRQDNAALRTITAFLTRAARSSR